MVKKILKIQLSNMDIVLFALYKTGGILKKVHTEVVAWEAYQLAKKRFSWRLPEFREKGFPDKTPVRFALEAAKKKVNGNLVIGRAGGDINRPELEGWRFTPEGAKWINQHKSRIIQVLKHEEFNIPKLEAVRFIKQLKTDPSFISFLTNKNLDDVSSYMFTDMLAIPPDAPKEIIKQKFEQLLTTANLVNDKKITKFLNACARKFSEYLSNF